MGIDGTVKVSLSANTQATVTMPRSGLTVIGVQTSADAHLTIPLNTSENAILFSDHALTSPPIVTFTQVLTTNQFFITSDGACDCYVYYGTPFPGAKPLSAYKGVYKSFTAASGTTGTFTLTFPGGQKNATGIMASASASYYDVNFNSSVGESFYFFGAPNLEYGIVAMNAKLPDSLTVNWTTNAALTGYVVIYYQ